MTPEERAVIDAAIALHDAPPMTGQRGVAVVAVMDAVREMLVTQAKPPTKEEPQWIGRTMEDVRTGDVVRLPSAPDLVARVVFALPGDWHVRSGGHGPRGRFDDVPLEHGKVALRLDYPGVQRDGEGRPALMELPATTPVEIQLSSSELQAIELLGGFGNRVRMEAGQ